MSAIINTKFGRASINQRGYYDIITQKEGNFRKKLHRLIYEDCNKVSLLPWADIHHKDGNKLNNSIENLELIPHDVHTKLHHTGKSAPRSLESNIKQSSTLSSTKYFRVTKHKQKNVKQGFAWRYQYYEDNKRKGIQKLDLKDLEKAVKEKDLPWMELEESR